MGALDTKEYWRGISKGRIKGAMSQLNIVSGVNPTLLSSFLGRVEQQDRYRPLLSVSLTAYLGSRLPPCYMAIGSRLVSRCWKGSQYLCIYCGVLSTITGTTTSSNNRYHACAPYHMVRYWRFRLMCQFPGSGEGAGTARRG